MKIAKLELSGFKSFHEKTSIHFPPGISAVVGPNGCGKSNVMDALRWVMGEQSVKQLRGKAMEDVIFAGTSGKPPLNLAEVSLTLINDNGSSPEALRDFSEIMLTRRLYRSGESTYFINKQPCRLKDIHHVFMGSGIGAKSYAVIQQGNIGSITEASPDERRSYIEEAAGITRYKTSKAEALRKLEQTQQNMLRLSDIINEISLQMKSLDRQVQKAEKYRRLQKKIRRCDVLLALFHYDNFLLRLGEYKILLNSFYDQKSSDDSRLSKLQAAIESIKFNHLKINEKISEKMSHKHECQRQIDRLENELGHALKDIRQMSAEIEALKISLIEHEGKDLKITEEIEEIRKEESMTEEDIKKLSFFMETEKTALQSIRDRLFSLRKEKDTLKSELLDLTTQQARMQHIIQHSSSSRESLKRRLKRADEEEHKVKKELLEFQRNEDSARQAKILLNTEVRSLTENIDHQKTALKLSAGAISQQVIVVQSLEIEKTRISSKYGALKKMADNFEWYHEGVRTIMKIVRENEASQKTGCHELSGIVGPIADILNPEPSYETALEAAMGESLQYLLARDFEAGIKALSFLERNQAGRCGFFPVDDIPNSQQSDNPDLQADRLINHVKVTPGYEHVAEAILGDVIIAENISDALINKDFLCSGKNTVTKGGRVLSSQGVLLGGKSSQTPGILSKKKELSALELEISQINLKLESSRKTKEAMESDSREQEVRLQKLIEKKNKTFQEELEAEKKLYKVSESVKQSEKRLEMIQLEQEQLSGEETDIADEINKNNSILTSLATRIDGINAKISVISAEIDRDDRQVEASNQKWMEINLQLTTLHARLENARNTLRRLISFQEDKLKQIAEISSEISVKSQKITSSAQKAADHEKSLVRRNEEIMKIEKTLLEYQNEFDATVQDIKESDDAIRKINDHGEKTLQQIQLLEIEIAQITLKKENVVQRLKEVYHKDMDELRKEAESFSGSGKITETEDMETELSRLRERIVKIENVNLEAITEYEALKTRFDFLETQRLDMVKAIDDLKKLIRKINKITQDRFMETFNAVNEKIQEVFPELFEGGNARLILTDPEKTLETGVEFMIQPPGKKLTRISLFSGGEKALSAIAFIFSIFLIKPASFCLLDEIDAPLDEANVFRFNRLLQFIGKKSQIIMITHNKCSMGFSDTLIGITMEQKGISRIVSVNLEKYLPQ